MTPKLQESMAHIQTPNILPSLWPFDTCLQAFYFGRDKAGLKEELLYAHKALLVKSPFLKAQLQFKNLSPVPGFTTISLDLSMIEEPVKALKVVLNYIYTGVLNQEEANPQSLSYLLKLFELPISSNLNLLKSSEPFKMNQSDNKDNSFCDDNQNSAMPAMPLPIHPAIFATYLTMLQNQQNNQLLQNVLQQASARFLYPNNNISSIFPGINANVYSKESDQNRSELRLSESEQSEAPSVASTCSSTSTNTLPAPSTSPLDNNGDVLVPSSEKEGWCRNKKYIQTVQKGYRCTVCNKVYGRYNSVSYHVTIYHRNPPIKCEEQGCQFTTREARYIHFHKYYRHGVPLPESIDLASRKCPFFSCKHVSKSPAMLDKHINRHVADCTKDGQNYDCPKCPYSTKQQREMFEHLRSHQLGTSMKEEPGVGPILNETYKCGECPFKARTMASLEQHKLCKHLSNPFQIPGDAPKFSQLSPEALNLASLSGLPGFPANLLNLLSSEH